MDAAQLKERVKTASVFARVSPEHKLNIVTALQELGQIVAMTGDGVNDAPALKKADIGVAMGITGTDVSKEAADMVLLDDNFATIVSAVREGRRIYENIRKFVKYTMTSNFGEIIVMLVGPFVGLGLPLLPLQILWVNLVTDGLPGLALTQEPSEPDTMKRPPRDPKENMFSRGLGMDVLWIGALMGAVSLLVGLWAFHYDHASAWQTMIFTTLTLAQMGNALASRSEHQTLWKLEYLPTCPFWAQCCLLSDCKWRLSIFPSCRIFSRQLPVSAGIGHQFRGQCAGIAGDRRRQAAQASCQIQLTICLF